MTDLTTSMAMTLRLLAGLSIVPSRISRAAEIAAMEAEGYIYTPFTDDGEVVVDQGALTLRCKVKTGKEEAAYTALDAKVRAALL